MMSCPPNKSTGNSSHSRMCTTVVQLVLMSWIFDPFARPSPLAHDLLTDQLDYRIQFLQFDPRIFRPEPPAYFRLCSIPRPFPCSDLPAHLFDARHPPIQTLPGQHTQLGLRHVQPTPMLRRG